MAVRRNQPVNKNTAEYFPSVIVLMHVCQGILHFFKKLFGHLARSYYRRSEKLGRNIDYTDVGNLFGILFPEVFEYQAVNRRTRNHTAVHKKYGFVVVACVVNL